MFLLLKYVTQITEFWGFRNIRENRSITIGFARTEADGTTKTENKFDARRIAIGLRDECKNIDCYSNL